MHTVLDGLHKAPCDFIHGVRVLRPCQPHPDRVVRDDAQEARPAAGGAQGPPISLVIGR